MRMLLLCLAIAALVGNPPSAQADAPADTSVTVTRCLVLGPAPLPLPAFHASDDRGVDLAALLETASLPVAGLWPRDGDEVAPGLRWREATAGPAGFDLAPASAGPAEAWLAFWLAADRWQKAELRITAPPEVQILAWVDGAAVTLKTDDQGRQGDLELEPGRRLVLIRSAVPQKHDGNWTIAPVVRGAAMTADTSPRRFADIHLILDAPRISSAVISPDGELAAVELGAYTPDGKRERWLEVRRVDDGRLVGSWRPAGDLQGVAWLPSGRRLSYTTSDGDRSDLWRYDLATGRAERVLRAVEHLGAYRWAPDGSFVVHEIGVKPKADERKVKRVENPADRQPTWRERSYLVRVDVPGGLTRRLTAGPLSPGGWEISPDGRRLLFFLEDQDLTARPYFTSTLHELDLVTCTVAKVLDERWIEEAHYVPTEPDLLLLRGAPSAFDGAGSILAAGVQANDYGGQLYLWDRAAGRVTPLSRDLTPDVTRSWWSRADGKIYALCTDRMTQRVYRRDPRDGARWELVPCGEDDIEQFDLALTAPVAVARGTSATQPNRLHAVDLKRGRVRLLVDPGQETWRDVAFGAWETWEATLPSGETIDGHVLYPPDFDPSRRYPVIVFYYGGTSPVSVGFGSRYPRNVWAALGYVVYVPQPSGATGYGQEFAARHVNDWGRRTADEVIESTRAFLAAHPFADPERVGCIGASYGGFLTEFILTRTDLFACGISHAGISSISSYWGEGLWGYVYGARALAHSFPWQDRDLFIDQSPLFHADRITTPLLLLHGASDTNVPVGESDQLFTALKLLGRDVEYVQVLGQDHWILDHDQRIVWNDTILAYFARYLKGEPEWWEDLYPRP